MRRPLIFAILAGLAAILAAIIVFSALKRREAEVQKALASTVEIVVAAQDLRLGQRLDSGSVKLARWSRNSVPAGAFTDPQAVINSFVRIETVAGEPVVASKLFMGEKTAGVMPLLIPDGMRAMAVPVDEVSDIAGFVQPRAHVDVLVSVSGSGRDQPSFSRMVLQDIEVLAVAQEIEKKNDEPEEVKVVTLLVTPEQSEKLALASHEGQLRLSMRNYTDNRIITTSGAEMQDLHALDTPAIHDQAVAAPLAGPVAAPRTLNVQIMRDGKDAESVSFVKSAPGAHSMSMMRALPAPAAAAPAVALGSSAAVAATGAQASATIMAPPLLATALGPVAGQSAPPADATPSNPDATGYQPAPKTIAIP
ncbi:MAG: Flp pilus assembly protein CpaB [Candidatus Binataceae bacterium]